MVVTGAHADQRTKGFRLGLASGLNLVSQILSLVIALGVTPLLVHRLGKAAYGMLATVSAFTSYFAYLELGIGAAYLRHLSLAISGRDPVRAQRLIETAHTIYSRIAVIGTVLMFAIGLPYLGTTQGDGTLVTQARIGLLATAATFAITMTLSTVRGVVFAAQRADLYSRASLVLQPLVPVSQAVAVLNGGGLISILVLQGLGSVGIDLAMVYYARKLHPELRVRARFHRDIWGDFRSFSMYKFVTHLAQQGQLSGDRLLVASMRGSAEVATYAVAASVAQRVRLLAWAFAGPFVAAAIDAYAQHGAPGLARITSSYVRRVATIVALGCAAGGYLAYPFLNAWMGHSYADEGTRVLQALVIATAFLVVGSLMNFANDAAGRAEPGAWSTIVGLTVSVGSGAFLVARLGPVGAAYGFLAGSAVQLIWTTARLSVIVGSVAARGLVGWCVARPAVVGVSAYAIMRLMPRGDGLVHAVAVSLAALGVGVVVALALGLHRRAD